MLTPHFNVTRLWAEYLVTGYTDQSEEAKFANRAEAQYHASIVVESWNVPVLFDQYLATPENFTAALAYVVWFWASLNGETTYGQGKAVRESVQLPHEFAEYLRTVVAALGDHG